MEAVDLESLIAFNYAPGGYIDNTWLETLPNYQVVQFLKDSPEAAIWISRYILKAFDLEGKPDLDFSRKEKELALASRNVLTPVVFHAGLALNNSFLKGIVKRQERHAVTATLGESGFQYAIKKGPYLAGQLPNLFHTEFTMNWNEPGELKKHIFRSGVRLLGAVFAKEPDSFSKRLLFKFPSQSKDYFYAGSAASYSDDVPRLGGIMLRKLMKEFIQ